MGGRKSGPGRSRDWGNDKYEERMVQREVYGSGEEGGNIGTGETERAEIVFGEEGGDENKIVAQKGTTMHL